MSVLEKVRKGGKKAVDGEVRTHADGKQYRRVKAGEWHLYGAPDEVHYRLHHGSRVRATQFKNRAEAEADADEQRRSGMKVRIVAESHKHDDGLSNAERKALLLTPRPKAPPRPMAATVESLGETMALFVRKMLREGDHSTASKLIERLQEVAASFPSGHHAHALASLAQDGLVPGNPAPPNMPRSRIDRLGDMMGAPSRSEDVKANATAIPSGKKKRVTKAHDGNLCIVFPVNAPAWLFIPKTEDQSPPHCTFLFIGAPCGVSASKIAQISRRHLRRLPSVTMQVDKALEAFIRPGLSDVWYMPVEVPEQHVFEQVRAELIRDLRQAGVEVADKDPLRWTPHVTWSYGTPKRQPWAKPVKFSSSTVELWTGSRTIKIR